MRKTFKIDGQEHYAIHCQNEYHAAHIFIKNKCAVTLDNIKVFDDIIPEGTNYIYNAIFDGENCAKKLDITDVIDSKLYSERDIKTAVVEGILVWQEREEQTVGGLYTEIMKYLKTSI